jgi:hypothetical protein
VEDIGTLFIYNNRNLEIKVSKYLKSLFISAGDGVKFNLPMAAATTVLSWGLDRWKDAYIQAMVFKPHNTFVFKIAMSLYYYFIFRCG